MYSIKSINRYNFYIDALILLFDKDQTQQSCIITPSQEVFIEKYCITSRMYFV